MNPTLQVEPDSFRKRTVMEIGLEIASLTGLLYSYVLAIVPPEGSENSYPVHFGITGEPDAWGSSTAMFLLPILGTIFYLLLTILRRMPHKFNYPVPLSERNVQRQVRLALLTLAWVKLELVWSFTYIHARSIDVAAGLSAGLGSFFLPLFLGIIVGTAAIYFLLAFRSR